MPNTSYKIDRVTLRRVRIPLHEPFRIANGAVSEKESIIIEATSDNVTGYGEASPMSGSFYSVDTPDSAWAALKNDLVPDLLSRTIGSPVDYAKSLDAYGKEPFARAGIEGAVWHLAALRMNTTIRGLIGGYQHPIPSGLAVGLYDTIPELLARIEGHLRAGYLRVKIKIQPGWDVEPLRAIRKKFGDIYLMVDANGSYNLREHKDVLKSFDAFTLLMIEQPFAGSAIEDMGVLAHEIATPVCADESADSMESLSQILIHQAASIINIKVQRVGGLWNAKSMHDRAVASGLSCWLGTMPELGIAGAQALSIASLPGFRYPTDVEESDRWYIDDIIAPKITINQEGYIVVPEGKGMGYEVDLEKLERYTTLKEEFTS